MTDTSAVTIVAESWLTFVGMAVTFMFTAISVAVTLAWWLSKQFTSMRNLIFTEIHDLRDMLLEKIEYHEKHDDKRFADIRDNLWEIRVGNASRDAAVLKELAGKEPTRNAT